MLTVSPAPEAEPGWKRTFLNIKAIPISKTVTTNSGVGGNPPRIEAMSALGITLK